MTTAQLIIELQKFPADSTPLVMPMDYTPQPQVQVANVVNQGATKTLTNPLLLIFFGPGYTFIPSGNGFGNIENA
jgi:hypothetical protein